MAVLNKTKNKEKELLGGGGDGHGFEHKVVIRLPTLRILSVLVRSLIVAAAIASFPWIRSAARISASESDNGGAHFLPSLFHDLQQNGLLKAGAKALLIGQPAPISTSGDLNLDIIYFRSNGNDGNANANEDDDRSVPDESFDFTYTAGFAAAGFVDRTLKTHGLAAIRLGGDPSTAFRVPPHFEIVYVRQFDDATVVAIRKLAAAAAAAALSQTRRRLLAVDAAAKRAALDGLEDALLEPLRSPSRRSKQYLRRIRYLPQLTGDSLAAYPRRVFITVGGADGWLERNYPRMSRGFEQYRVEAVSGGDAAAPAMSEWLRENVKEEEYVVMKAEAEVVEEMVKSKAIELVDELFLECSHQGGGKKKGSKRAYWECVALYGKLRDQGVAVHQWWS